MIEEPPELDVLSSFQEEAPGEVAVSGRSAPSVLCLPSEPPWLAATPDPILLQPWVSVEHRRSPASIRCPIDSSFV